MFSCVCTKLDDIYLLKKKKKNLTNFKLRRIFTRIDRNF